MSEPRVKVKLSEIADSIDAGSDTLEFVVDRQTGEVIALPEDMDRFDEDEDLDAKGLPQWQREQAELARLIATDESDRFVPLPGRDDYDGWGIMSGFVEGLEPGVAREVLESAIHGKGAFGRFKDGAARYGLLDRWYAYRDGCLREIAAEWCKEHGVEWEDDRPGEGSGSGPGR